MFMVLYRFCFIFCIIISMVGCGINGQPLSPSEASATTQTESLFPFNSETDDKQDTHQNKRDYLSTSELEQMGYDYNANFGIENDTLDDVFERIKPKSSLLKKRAIIPLKRDYE